MIPVYDVPSLMVPPKVPTKSCGLELETPLPFLPESPMGLGGGIGGVDAGLGWRSSHGRGRVHQGLNSASAREKAPVAPSVAKRVDLF